MIGDAHQIEQRVSALYRRALATSDAGEHVGKLSDSDKALLWQLYADFVADRAATMKVVRAVDRERAAFEEQVLWRLLHSLAIWCMSARADVDCGVAISAGGFSSCAGVVNAAHHPRAQTKGSIRRGHGHQGTASQYWYSCRSFKWVLR